MTVSTTTNKVSYIGNGITTEFAIPFPFLEKSHLKVYQLLNDIQAERTDWTVSDGNLIFATAPSADSQIVIIREVPYIQETDYQENEILAAETLERNFDNLTMQIQQLAEKSERAVTVDVFDDVQASELLPSIREAVSDAAGYAQTAAQQAQNAQTAASTAQQKAEIATNKAEEATNILENKANKDLSNCTRPYITSTYKNGTEWYRIWSDGLIEQGGYAVLNSYNAGVTISLLKPYTTTTYVFALAEKEGSGGANLHVHTLTTTSFKMGVTSPTVSGNVTGGYWQTKGY